jgi:formamidopyrimidine-DNA glycosylase
LFAELGSGHHVLLHLGMTGDIYFYSHEEERTKHERFHWKLSGGQYMGFNDPRKFGRIIYIKNLQEYINEIRLGPDALSISELEFQSKMEKRRTNIKAFLLDQHVLAGVGNLYADEICYQVRVHPASMVNAIPKRKRKMLYDKMREVLNYACNNDAYYGVYPEDWFWKWRETGMKNPNGKGTVNTSKIAGRTTYYVPGWQKLYR